MKGEKMKRKILGLTMNVLRQYDNKRHCWFTQYNLINPASLCVVNILTHELGGKHPVVFNNTIEREDLGRDIYIGSIDCYEKSYYWN